MQYKYVSLANFYHLPVSDKMDRLKPRPLYPIDEVTPVDDQIRRVGGSTSTLDRLPSRLQQSKYKRSTSLRDEMEELAYENGSLKAELAWNREKRQALMQLKDKYSETVSILRDALAETESRLQQCDARYLELWGISSGGQTGVI